MSRAVSEDFHGLFLNSFLPKSLFHRTELELTFIVHRKLMLIAFDFLQFSSHLEVKAPPDQSESFLGLAIYNLNSFFSSFFFGLVIFISSLFFYPTPFFFFRLSFGSLEMDLFSPASYIDVCKGFADFFLWWCPSTYSSTTTIYHFFVQTCCLTTPMEFRMLLKPHSACGSCCLKFVSFNGLETSAELSIFIS